MGLTGHLAHLVYLYELAVARNSLHVQVFICGNHPAGQASATSITFARVIAIDRLRQGQSKLVLPYSSRPRQNKRLPDPTFGDRALEQLLYSFVSSKR
jgi:hypothetical protein